MWKGGLGHPRGVIGGALALLIYTKAKKLVFGSGRFYRSRIVVSAIGGRWGNFVTIEV